MQSEEERTLNNLHVIGALSHNDKLCTAEDVFDIYAPTSMRGLLRMWYGERRGQNVQRVRQTVRAGIGFAQRSLEEVQALGDTGETMRLRVDTMALQHLRMMEGLRRASGGMQNLLQTYREDAALYSQISLLIAEMEDFGRVLTPHTESLRERCAPYTPAHSLLRSG